MTRRIDEMMTGRDGQPKEAGVRSIRTVKPPLEQDYVVDRNYSVNAYLRGFGLPNRATPADQVWFIDCPRCGTPSFYDNSRSDTCKACAFFNLADYAKDAYTLKEYANRQAKEVIENGRKTLHLPQSERMHR